MATSTGIVILVILNVMIFSQLIILQLKFNKLQRQLKDLREKDA